MTGKPCTFPTLAEPLLVICVAVLAVVFPPVLAGASERAELSALPERPASLQRIWDAQRRTPPDADAVCFRKIRHFEVHDEDLPTAIARFCKEQGLLCGMALVPGDPDRSPRLPDPPFKRLYAIFDDSYAGCVVTTLSELDRAFEYRSEQGLITVVLNPPFDHEKDPLRTVIPKFTARNVPYPIALFGDPAWSEAVAPAPLFRSESLPEDFNVNMAAGGPAWDQYPRLTCSYSNRTLLYILNDIARQLKLSWRLFDNSLLGGSGIDFVMDTELPTTPDLATLAPGPLAMSPRGERPLVSTGEAAVARAVRFFEDVGWRAEGAPTAAFPALRRDWKCWDVTLESIRVQPGGLSAEVESQSGAVVGSHKRGLSRPRTYEWALISESTANRLAVEYLEAGGLPLDDAHLLSSDLNRDADQWRVRFRRIHNGVLFRGDFILVLLDPEDGSLRGYGYNFHSPLPDSTRVLVSEEEAVRLARDYLAGLWMQAGNLVSTELLIVQPNDYWECYDVGVMTPPPTLSRLAWVLTFDAPWEKTQVWVDAESGYVLGGVYTIGRAKPGTGSGRPALRGTIKITIERPGGPAEPVTLAASSPEGKKLLAGISGMPRARDGDCEPRITLRFDTPERSYLLGYSPDDERLVLLEKRYRGKIIKGNVAWEVSEEAQQVLSQYVG